MQNTDFIDNQIFMYDILQSVYLHNYLNKSPLKLLNCLEYNHLTKVYIQIGSC